MRNRICLFALVVPLSVRAAEPTSRPATADVLRTLNIPNPAYAAAVEKGDEAAAAHLLVEHFAARKPLEYAPELFTQTHDDTKAAVRYLRDEPDRVLRNQFAFVFEYLEPGADIDWNGRYGKDREATWWINRFFFLDCLARESDRTGDARYARHGVVLMLDWVRKNPAADAQKAWGAWRNLEVGLRLAEWARFLDVAAARRLVQPAELAALLASLREQTEYMIAGSRAGRGNWGFMEQCGIGTVAAVFPEFTESRRWLAGVFEVHAADVARQIYPDGSHEELTTHYGLVVVHTLGKLLDLCRQRKTDVPPALIDALRRSTAYSTLTLKPDLTLPMFSDGDAVDPTPLLRRIARAFDLPEAMYVMTCGAEGVAPPLCRLFPHSGIAVFRDSWKADARCLFFDAGPFGTGHQHEDALQFDVSAFGRGFIVDPGRYSYAASPIRDYLVGTAAHATVRVDGADQARRRRRDQWRSDKPVDARLLANDVLALAAADYNAGYAAKAALGVTHTREILFVNREYWVVSDVLRGKGRHRIEQNFQYTPGLLDVKDGRAVTGHADANLAMLWLWPAAAQARAGIGEDNPSCGWYSSSYGRVEKAPHLELSAELQLPARVTLVLYPFKGAKAPALNAESLSVLGPDAANAAAVSVTIGGRKDIVLLSDPRASPAVLDSAGGVPLERKSLNAALIRDGQTTVLSP